MVEPRLPGDRVGRGVAAVTRWSVRHAKAVVATTLLAALVLSLGLQHVHIDAGITDWLSDSDPDKQAMDRVMDKLQGVSTLEAVVLQLDPDKAGPLGITDVRQEGAIRAEEHFYQFLDERVDALGPGVGLNHVVKQVRVVLRGDDAYYEMPPPTPDGSAEFQSIWSVANNTIRPNIELTIRNPDYQSTILALGLEAEPNSPTAKAAARQLLEATAEYRAMAASGALPPEHDIWLTEFVDNVGPTSGLARFEDALKDDLPRLMPIAFTVILASLWIGLRNPGSAIIGILTLGIATGSTIGLMGWLAFPFNVANVSMIPLIIGNGIDYAIHVLNEYSEERSKGKDLVDTFDFVGRRAGVAMVLATATSVTGVLAIALSDSLALKQLAYSASFALVTVTFLSITFIPAATALFGDRLQVGFKPTAAMGRLHRFVSRNRVVTVAIFLVASGVLYANTANLQYYTELTASNFPEGDRFRETYEHVTARQLGSSDELIIIEGDLTDPATLRYIAAIEDDLFNKTDMVRTRAHVNSLTVLLGAYELLGNTANAAGPAVQAGLEQFIADPTNPQGISEVDYPRKVQPTSRADIERDIAAMQASVAWRPLIDFLYSNDGNLTIIDVLVDADSIGHDFEDVKYIHDEIWKSIEQAEPLRPDDVTVHLNGLSTGVYLYLDYSFYWLKVLFAVSAVAAMVLVFAFTKSLRAVGATLVPMVFTTIWWFGAIAFFDIQVAISLIVPIIFITSIGSDYSAHLAWNILKSGEPEEVYRTTGKAILFSAITDFGAFLVFSFAYLTAPMADVALATAIAILCIFVVTMMSVPLFFPGARKVFKRRRKAYLMPGQDASPP